MTSQNKAVLWILAVFATGVLFGGAVSFFAVRSATVPPPFDIAPLDDPGPPEQTEEPGGEHPLEPGEEPRSLERPDPSSGRPGDRRHNPMEDLRRLARYLGLTAEQYSQLGQILQRATQRFQAANKEHRQRQRRIRFETMRELRTILTEEQKERFDEFIRSRQERRRGPPQERRRGSPPQRQPR